MVWMLISPPIKAASDHSISILQIVADRSRSVDHVQLSMIANFQICSAPRNGA